MAASTINRDHLADDTGSAEAPNGDGTVIDDSVLQNYIYARVDELFAGAGTYSTLTVGGKLGAEGFGFSTFQSAGSGAHGVVVRNTSAGATNSSQLRLGNDGSVTAGVLVQTSSSFVSSPPWVLDGLHLIGERIGGLVIGATHPSGIVKFLAGDTSTERARVDGTGLLMPNGSADAPSVRFQNGISTGFYSDAVNEVDLACGGVRVFSANGYFVQVAGAFAREATMTPPALPAGSTNNWPFTGGQYQLRLQGDAGGTSALTGLAYALAGQGTTLSLFNASAYAITLKHESASSTDVNRFLCPGAADLVLHQYDSVTIERDDESFTGRWIVKGT